MNCEPDHSAEGRPLLRIILCVTMVLSLLHAGMVTVWNPATIGHLYPWIIVMLDAVVILVAAAVSFLAFGRYLVLRDPVSYWTGMAFAAAGIGFFFHMLAWPGLLSGGGTVFGSLPSTGIWVSLAGLTFLAACLLAAGLSRWPHPAALCGRRWLWSLIPFLFCVTLGGIVTIFLERYLPRLVAANGAFTTTTVIWGDCLLVLLAVGAALSARHYHRTGDTLPGYVSFTQIVTAFALLMASYEQNRYGLLLFLDRFVAFGGFVALLFGLLLEYVRLFRHEREKSSALGKAREGLERANEELEERVAERTRHLEEQRAELEQRNCELVGMQGELEKQIAATERAMEEVREGNRMLIQQSRLAAMGELVGNIAHQWRQPLNMLALLAQEMPVMHDSGNFSAGYLDATVQRILERIEFLSRTIDDFRDFARADSAKAEFKVVQAAERAVSLVEGSLAAQQVRTAIIAACDPVVYGYPNEFSQVLCNIMINARDAFVMQQVASPTITIEVAEEGGRCIVTITDNAGGIPEEVMDKIFDPYFTTKGPDQGLGIALYMSKLIIEKKMGGSLSARNVCGGAQFRIEVVTKGAEGSW